MRPAVPESLNQTGTQNGDRQVLFSFRNWYCNHKNLNLSATLVNKKSTLFLEIFTMADKSNRRPLTDIPACTLDFETHPLVKPTGFREYDARWWFGSPDAVKASELNLYGVQALGEGLGTLMYERGAFVYKGQDYDCGSKLGYFKAVLVYARTHVEIGDEARKLIQAYAAEE